MKTMTLKETNDYVLSHGVLKSYGQVVLTKPMKVFKKVYNSHYGLGCIANLIIPEGATVNLAQTGHLKLRASKACCVSILTIDGKHELSMAWSGYNCLFSYKPGHVYRPKNGFCTTKSECAPGIHFFAELKLALEY